MIIIIMGKQKVGEINVKIAKNDGNSTFLRT